MSQLYVYDLYLFVTYYDFWWKCGTNSMVFSILD